jgi:hypothetical protein
MNELKLLKESQNYFWKKIKVKRKANSLIDIQNKILNHDYFNKKIKNKLIASDERIKNFLKIVRENNYQKCLITYFPDLVESENYLSHFPLNSSLILLFKQVEEEFGQSYLEVPDIDGYKMVDWMTFNAYGPNSVDINEIEILTLAWLLKKHKLDNLPVIIKKLYEILNTIKS